MFDQYWLAALPKPHTRCMLQVGAKITDAALSFASFASNFKPTSSISFVSHVAPRAVADYQHNEHSEGSKSRHKRTGRHLAGVLMKK